MSEWTKELEVRELPKKVEEAYQEANITLFSGALPSCRFTFSRRLTRSAGNVDTGLTTKMTLSIPYFLEFGWEVFYKTLLHEMVHIWMVVEYRGMRRGIYSPHGLIFKAKLAEVGGAFHNETMQDGKKYHYKCKSCGRDVYFSRQLKRRKSCGRCLPYFSESSELIFQGKRQ